MTRTIAALLAAASIAGFAAPAAAQTRYFARERLVGMTTTSAPSEETPSTYAGTWRSQSGTPTYSRCTAGAQQVSYQPTCMKDGVIDQSQASCDPAARPGATTTTTRACTLNCETPTATNINYYDRDAEIGRFEAGTSLENAIRWTKALCEARSIASTKDLAYCQVYYNANGLYYAYIISVATQKFTSASPNKVWVGQCTRQ
jgi:hypothetical protein